MAESTVKPSSRSAPTDSSLERQPEPPKEGVKPRADAHDSDYKAAEGRARGVPGETENPDGAYAVKVMGDVMQELSEKDFAEEDGPVEWDDETVKVFQKERKGKKEEEGIFGKPHLDHKDAEELLSILKKRK